MPPTPDSPIRRRRPWLLSALLCIGIGLVVNVAIVMACAYARATASAPEPFDGRFWSRNAPPSTPVTSRSWPVQPPAGWPAAAEFQSELARVAWTDRFAGQVEFRDQRFDKRWSISVSEFGWPARSAWFWVTSVYDRSAGTYGFQSHGFARLTSVPVPLSITNWRRWDVEVPLTPLWPGLIANTLFYTTFAYLALLAARALRRTIRRRRGGCPACAYP
ncbi:MAG: hypothetical protein K2Q20_04705, partial [Phycisphaerales bacterium]|nr:hypothetical protein [Phycisphaerales bacterium]